MRERAEERKIIKAFFLLRKELGICGLLILGLILGLSGTAGGFSAEFGDTCEGLSAGDYHTCVLKSDGNVHCFGNNAYDQAIDYGQGDALGVAAGGYHTCVLKADGNVACFGNNAYVQAVEYSQGDALGVAAGGYHTCVLKADGNVVCFGNNGYGQAVDYGEWDAIGVSVGDCHTCVLKADGNVTCFGNNAYGQAIDYSECDAVGVAAGGYHTCVLKADGNVACFGLSHFGQADDYTEWDAVGVSTGRYHTCVLKSDGNVHCFGNNAYGQAIDYTEGDAVGVSTGWYHTCVLKADGNVACFGHNAYSQAIDYTEGDAVCSLAALNQPPDCSEAYVDPVYLWPPNHEFVEVNIMGVTDPEGDEVTMAATSITSDEPTATAPGAGGATHAPDAEITEDGRVLLRAERSGNGDGRVYVINFTAADEFGQSCSSSVSVRVNHSKKKEAIDSGQNYDATQIDAADGVFRITAKPKKIKLRQLKRGKTKKVTVLVRDAATRKKVEDAQVTISGCGITEGSGLTDRRGKVVIEGVAPTDTGSIQATVTKDGYDDGNASILVVP